MGGTSSCEGDRAAVKEEDWPVSEVTRDELQFVPRAPSEQDNVKSSANEAKDRAASSDSLSRVINLDVGGTRVRTTMATLKANHEPHSFFRGMFSGKFKELPDDKDYFIDRDGKHFQLILNWLRNPNCFAIPSDEQSRNELWAEADFYRLEGLCARLETADNWNVESFPIKVLDDTRYPHPPRRFSVTLPQTATFGDLRYVICAVIGYQPDHFDLLINYTRKVPRTADFQLISSWNFKPGETTLLRARGYNPQGDYSQTKFYKHMKEQRDIQDEKDRANEQSASSTSAARSSTSSGSTEKEGPDHGRP